MWIPKTEAEIIHAVENNSLEETAIFDAKKELTTNNHEIAKDIAAMANDGGVIIYGIGEDEHGRVNVLNPFNLHGQSERIDAIVRSSIEEPPTIHILTITTLDDPSKGYIVVFIPPSERAPHMVVVKGENRYYGRAAKGNIILTEGEVARLYTRREKIDVDLKKIIDDEINSAPYPPNSNFGYLFLFARPLFQKEKFIEPIAKNGEKILDVIKQIVSHSAQPSVFPHSKSYPDFYAPSGWIQRAEGFLVELTRPNDPDSLDAPGNTLNLDVELNGTVHLFCGRIAERKGEHFFFYPHNISGLTLRFLYFCAELCERSGYIGNIDIGLAVTGIQGCVAHMPNPYHFIRYATPYTRNSYLKTNRVSTLALNEDPKRVAKALIMPLLSALTMDNYVPYET